MPATVSELDDSMSEKGCALIEAFLVFGCCVTPHRRAWLGLPFLPWGRSFGSPSSMQTHLFRKLTGTE